MNCLLLGSGGREHAMAWALGNSKSLDKLFCTPGNPGIFEHAEKADLSVSNHDEVVNFCKDNSIDLVVVGPEQPLADGIADRLIQEGIKCFGPVKNAARLESSKGFAKEFMKKYGIPTAGYGTFTKEQTKEAHEFIDNMDTPVVLKADGLAGGKGVIIAETKENAHSELDEMFSGKFKSAGNTVVIEEFLIGQEASILAVADGNGFLTLASSQDHKRALNDDKGPNTGGMGAYAPAPIVTDEVLEKVKAQVLKPAIDGMKQEGSPFVGCLYAGLMIHNGEPSVVEFNVRFGDPETQVVLAVLDADFAGLLHSAASGKVDESMINETSNGFACCITLASEGYPGTYDKGFEITGLGSIDKNSIVFHAGTKEENGKIISWGGRVLSVTGKGDSLKDSIDSAYREVEKINFKNKYFRTDIGKKGLS